MGGSSTPRNKCGLTELLIFIAAIITGTACSVCSKTMMDLEGIGIDGDVESFSKPLFQTFGMFVGMLFGLVMHVVVVLLKIPFPGYDHNPVQAMGTILPQKTENYGAIAGEKDGLIQAAPNQTPSAVSVPLWMYFFLAIPSIFDLMATALCMMGLRFLDVSVYQLLRGSGIIFVALMKQHVLGDHLYRFQWLGVFWNVVSVILVGGTAILNTSSDETQDSGEALLGVLLVMAGAFVQALQFVFEEKVMTMDDASVPPLLLIGMEGFWGTLLCLTVVYPLAYFLPGSDHGSYEDPFNTYAMVMNTPTIQWAFFIYFFAILGYNMFAILVTFLLNSVWHAILDNFRPITVWATDMFIYYVVAEAFGESWTKYSWVQLFGMFVLLYGTAVYNAPNAGSIKMAGKWFHFGFDMRHEYQEIEMEMQEAEMDKEWQDRKQTFKTKRYSSLAERSPHISVHTQALHGLAAAHV